MKLIKKQIGKYLRVYALVTCEDCGVEKEMRHDSVKTRLAKGKSLGVLNVHLNPQIQKEKTMACTNPLHIGLGQR